MKRALIATLLFVFAVLPLHALDLGDKAPEIAADEWVTGEPADPTNVDGTHFYLVEVWSVTCPPCVRSIPIMNDIQKRYADDGLKIVSFTSDTKEEVDQFISLHPIEYSSFIDKDGVSIINYMAADNRTTIPHAFLFDREGALVWIGNPLDNLEKRVKQVISGDLNREKAIALRDAQEDLQSAIASQDIGGLIDSLKQLQVLEPDNNRHYQAHYQILSEFGGGDENDIRELHAAWFKGAQDQPDGMAILSMVALEQGPYAARNPHLALAAAKRSFAIDSDLKVQAGINLADIYRSIGRVDLALATLDEVSGLTEDEDEIQAIESIRMFYQKIENLGKNPEAVYSIN